MAMPMLAGVESQKGVAIIFRRHDGAFTGAKVVLEAQTREIVGIMPLLPCMSTAPEFEAVLKILVPVKLIRRRAGPRWWKELPI